MALFINHHKLKNKNRGQVITITYLIKITQRLNFHFNIYVESKIKAKLLPDSLFELEVR